MFPDILSREKEGLTSNCTGRGKTARHAGEHRVRALKERLCRSSFMGTETSLPRRAPKVSVAIQSQPSPSMGQTISVLEGTDIGDVVNLIKYLDNSDLV